MADSFENRAQADNLRGDGSLGLPVLILPSLLVVILVWLPFGTAMIGSIEEWGMLGLFSTHGPLFIARPDGPLALHALRVLMPSSFAAAYSLDPNSFNGWHALQIVALAIKGVASTYLLWKATGSRFLAIVMGVLVLVYPADTMQLSFRSLHINSSTAIALLSCAVFMRALDEPRRIAALGTSTLAALLFFLASCVYEAALTLVLVPLLLLLTREGLRNWLVLLRSRLGLICIWFAGSGAYIGYAWWASKKVASYQQSLASGEGGIFAILSRSFPKLFTVGALRSLLGGWFDAMRILSTAYSSYSYLVAATLAVAVLAWVLVSRIGRGPGGPNSDPSSLTNASALRLASVGFALMLMGYAPFLLSQPHLAISQRTFLWATPGAAMVWVALLAWLARRTRVGASLAAMALIALGLGAQLFQFHHYVKISESQRAILRAIVENFDGHLDGKTLVVLDGTNQIGHTWMFLEGLLPQALSYFYGHEMGPIEICHQPSMEWHTGDSLGRKGTCARDDRGWIFSYPAVVTGPGYVSPAVPAERRVDARNAKVIVIDANGAVISDPALDGYRAGLDRDQDPIALRYRGVLKARPRLFHFAMFEDEKVGDSYRWDFGDYWSLEIPTRGSGWREAEWEVGRFHHKAAAWKTAETADLYFELLPAAAPYRLRGSFDTFAPESKKEDMKIRLNGNDIRLRWISADEVEGDVPSTDLKAGLNVVQIQLPVDMKYFGLSTRLDWIEIQRTK